MNRDSRWRRRFSVYTCIAMACTLAEGVLLPVHPAESLAKALKEGDVVVDLRYRLELVDQDGFSEDAQASTLRTRLGYKTGTFRGFYAYADLEDITVIGGEEFNSTANGLTQFPVVADPEDTEVNQVYLAYSGLKGTEFKLGRQRMTLDNQRFVGNVGWRQNEQTYDAFSVKSDITEKVSFFYAHLNNANRIFGESHPNPALADLNLFADLLNVSFKLSFGTLTGYTYLLETEDAPLASHRNVGVRFTGQHGFPDTIKLFYIGEFTDQGDYKDGAPTNDATYRLVELGVGFDSVTAKLGYEVLGGDGTYGFSTPLATLHAFNGWTDQFLVTPLTGLEDLYLSVAVTVSGYKFLAVVHDFGADEGAADYGSEWGLLVARTFKKMYSFSVKYANYDADTFSVDTEKLWITLQLKF